MTQKNHNMTALHFRDSTAGVPCDPSLPGKDLPGGFGVNPFSPAGVLPLPGVLLANAPLSQEKIHRHYTFF